MEHPGRLSEHSADVPLRSLSERAYQHIRGEILRGRLAVGTVVGESALADELGISKTPVRQALQLLRGEGLLQVGARRQLVVRGFSPEHRQEIVDVRQALEALAVRARGERMTLDDVDHLRLLLIRQKRAARRRARGRLHRARRGVPPPDRGRAPACPSWSACCVSCAASCA